MLVPMAPNQQWSLDFVSDRLTDGRRFRMLTVVDTCTRECLALIADTSLSGTRVARELATIIERRGKPMMIISDIGTEFTSSAILAFADKRKVDWHYSAPVWMPDGQSVLFYSMRGGKWEIWQVNADGGSLRKIVSLFAINPLVSPTGDRIAFSAAPQDAIS